MSDTPTVEDISRELNALYDAKIRLDDLLPVLERAIEQHQQYAERVEEPTVRAAHMIVVGELVAIRRIVINLEAELAGKRCP